MLKFCVFLGALYPFSTGKCHGATMAMAGNARHFVRHLLLWVTSLTLGFYLGARTGRGVQPIEADVDAKIHIPQTSSSHAASSLVLSGKLKNCILSRIKGDKMTQDDDDLVQYVRGHVMVGPASYDVPYKLRNSGDNADTSQVGQLNIIKDIFSNVIKEPTSTTQGFFIEVGAYNGEDFSNTLWFERNWGWSGLLIEPDRRAFGELLGKRRKAWAANTCLSPDPHPGKFTYFQSKSLSALNGLHETQHLKKDNVATTLSCIPLYALLVAINQTVVDLFSLDTEGSELDILKTLPFDKVRFKVLIIETWFITESHEGIGLVKTLLNGHGYKLHSKTPQDYIFIHEQYLSSDFAETIQY